jgi:hypothetical protein
MHWFLFLKHRSKSFDNGQQKYVNKKYIIHKPINIPQSKGEIFFISLLDVDDVE